MEPFNLEQFKQGRRAITRDGRTAEFLYYNPSLESMPVASAAATEGNESK